jgi:tRNA dimethylallyltransferase
LAGKRINSGSVFLKNNNNVLFIVGPTASGKSQAGFEVAKKTNGEIISADSRQNYKYMDIGTAKPSKEELTEVRHHFIDELLPDQNYNAGEYGIKARERIENLLHKGENPIVVGGSGLYIQALVDGFFDGPSADNKIRTNLEKRMEIEGAGALLEELSKIDPKAAAKMLPTNTRRIIRALEVYQITGSMISDLQKENLEPRFKPIMVGISWERGVLYNRINNRVDWMLESGLLEEVKQLLEKGYTSNLNALQTVGYQEAFKYFDGKLTYDEMVGLIKQNSRRYAKRQLTWFRRDERIKWFEAHNEDDLFTISRNIINYFQTIQESN